MKNKSSSVLVEDTEAMIGWRAMSQLEVDECWTKIAGTTEEGVLNMYKEECTKREAYRGRGAPLDWRLVQRSMKYRILKWCEDCWARIFSWFKEHTLQRIQSMQEGPTEEEEMKQQQRMKIMKEMTSKIRTKERMDANCI